MVKCHFNIKDGDKMKEENKKLNGVFRNLIKCWKIVKDSKKTMFIGFLFSLLLCIISAIIPLLSAKLLLNLTDGLFDSLIKAALFIFIIEITRNIFRYMYGIIVNKYMISTVIALQTSVAKETLKLKIDEIDKKSSGVFIDRINNDTKEIAGIFVDFGDTVIDVITNIGVLFAILVVNKFFFIYFVLTSLILFFVEKHRMKIYFDLDKKRRKFNEKNTGLIGELVRGIRDIKSLNSEEYFLKNVHEKLSIANNENYKMIKVREIYNLLIGNIKDIFDFLFIIIGVVLCNNNFLTIASFVIIYMYRNNVQNLIRYVSWLMEIMKKFNVAADRVFEVIGDNSFEKESFGNKTISKLNGDFEFKNVDFSYKSDIKILDNMCFKVSANETVAFVGKSGGGKSTIFSLLNKLYDVEDNSIFIDGIDINDLDKDSIRNNMSIITQNPYIFNFSIKENLKIVKPNCTDEEIIEVCKIACLHDFIISLPEKYETVVGEGGVTLSGGQRQRLAIARALIKKTEIILFDEATSALDNETQSEIQKAINNMKGEYTILIIAHRLSTVINSDRILLVDEGKVIDSGTHEYLLKNNEFYKNLYETELT